jgi:hypothetical protein
MDRLAGSGRVRGRSERAWGELRVLLEGAMEPDGKLPGYFQGCQCLGMGAALVMSRPVTGDAELMKEISSLTRKNALKFQAP